MSMSKPQTFLTYSITRICFVDIGILLEYNNMMKAKRNAEYLAMLDKSMAEAEAGGFVTKTIDELGEYES